MSGLKDLFYRHAFGSIGEDKANAYFKDGINMDLSAEDKDRIGSLTPQELMLKAKEIISKGGHIPDADTRLLQVALNAYADSDKKETFNPEFKQFMDSKIKYGTENGGTTIFREEKTNAYFVHNASDAKPAPETKTAVVPAPATNPMSISAKNSTLENLMNDLGTPKLPTAGGPGGP